MAKIQRNSPCPCGSGQKFKKCCIDIYQQNSPAHSCQDPECDADHDDFYVTNHSEHHHT